MTIRIKQNVYEVAKMEVAGELGRADMIARGWDGNFYMLQSKRGRDRLAFRNAKTGEFAIID